MTDVVLIELRRLAAAVEAQAGELSELRRCELPRMIREALRDELAAGSSVTRPQRDLLDALLAEFGDGQPFAGREVINAAASPLSLHEPLRHALRALGVRTAQQLGQVLRPLVAQTKTSRPRVCTPAGDRGARLWVVEGAEQD